MTASPIVGRTTELETLKRCLGTAVQGQRQLVFLSGEPGIGKTSIVDTFLQLIEQQPDVHIMYGQCVEQYGSGEAYLPLLEATSRACRGPHGGFLIDVLKQYAPSWLVQLPVVLEEAELAALQRRVQGTTQVRMLREMAEATEVLTAERTTIL